MLGIIKKMPFVLLSSIVSASNHTKYVSLSNQKCDIKLLLLIYILMNTINNFTIICLQLN